MRATLLSVVLLNLLSLPAMAEERMQAQMQTQVLISQAWTRATAPGQQVGAAYMTLQSKTDMWLEKVESPVAGSVEIHSMTMKDGVMQMRMMEKLALKANQQEKLEPGGFHLMLFDLKKPLKAGESVDFTLHFKDGAGKHSTQQLVSPIKRTAE